MSVLAAFVDFVSGGPVPVFEVCAPSHPMPTDANRAAWRHPDARLLTMTAPWPPDRPAMLWECQVCGEAWTVMP